MNGTDYTVQWCDKCGDATMHRYPGDETPNETLVCTRCEREHVWERSTFGTNIVCSQCGLLPLDSDDMETECEGR